MENDFLRLCINPVIMDRISDNIIMGQLFKRITNGIAWTDD